MALNTNPYKGARDFYPNDQRLEQYIFDIWSLVSKSFGYEQYNSSIIEPSELYLAKTSEEIVNEQTYSFEDRGGRKVTLRPEMTPSVSRMVAGKRQELSYPLRWFSIPNLWRYERPQRGRLREHWQLNVDIFGIDTIFADHEIILLADSIMKKFGAKDDMYVIRINSRKLVNYILNDYIQLDSGTSAKVVRLIDRMHKMSTEDFAVDISELCGKNADKLLKILAVNSLDQLPIELKLHDSVIELKNLQELLNSNSVRNAKFDISLMRGFDYYTDIVFEVFDTSPENNRSMFGGGRYDGLVGLFGVEPVPTVGFGMGDVTIRDFLETHNLLPQLKPSVDLYVILIGEVYLDIQKILSELRTYGLNVAVDSSQRKMDKMIKSANKAGYENILFVGETELKNNKYTLKKLSTGQEFSLSPAEISDVINKSR